MKLPRIFTWIFAQLDKCSSASKAANLLEKLHFEYLGEGTESRVYFRKGFDFVIKIMNQPHGQTPLSQIQCASETGKSFFVESFAVRFANFTAIVQKRIEPIIFDGLKMDKKLQTFISKVKRAFPTESDVHLNNVGLDRGSIKAFDWFNPAWNLGEFTP